MRILTTRPLALALALLAADVQAQSDAAGPPRWSAGVMALLDDTPYQEGDDRNLLVPILQYEGERVYFRGLSLGWRVDPQSEFQLELVARVRLDGFDQNDSPIFVGMAERKPSLDVGAAVGREFGGGRIEFSAFTDVLDRSGGQELDLMWSRGWSAGRVQLRPEVGVRWQSSDLVDYYYGVRADEATPLRPAYRAGSAFVPRAALNLFAPLRGAWSVFARVSYDALPDEITDSPLVDRSSERGALLGLTYAFR